VSRRGDTNLHPVRRAAILAGVIALCIPLAGCGSEPSDPAHPAAETVETVLEARAARSTDPDDYEPYFAEPSVAEALLESAESEDPAVPAIPDWESPYVSAETSASADVVVVWVPSDELPDWPRATVFSLEMDERWLVVDASDIETGSIPPELVQDGE
jgi:hypothetical protein